MHLRPVEAPPGAAKVAATNLRQILAWPDRHVLREVSASSLTLTLPHRVFALGLLDADTKRPLDLAQFTGWRFLIEAHRRTIAGIELDIDPISRELRFARLIQGPLGPAMAIAVDVAEAASDESEHVYEPCLLRVPALSLEALWLRASDSTADILVPLAPAPRRFETYRLYPVQTFVELLRAEIGESPVFDSSPRVTVPAG